MVEEQRTRVYQILCDPRPIESVTNGRDSCVGSEYIPLGRNCSIGFNAWATGAAYIFESRRNALDNLTWQTSEPWAS